MKLTLIPLLALFGTLTNAHSYENQVFNLGTIHQAGTGTVSAVAWALCNPDPCNNHTVLSVSTPTDFNNPCGVRFNLRGYEKLNYQCKGPAGTSLWQGVTDATNAQVSACYKNTTQLECTPGLKTLYVSATCPVGYGL